MYNLTCQPNKDSDQTAHPHSQIRGFIVHVRKYWVLSKDWSDFWERQTDLSLHCAYIQMSTFYCAPTHLNYLSIDADSDLFYKK